MNIPLPVFAAALLGVLIAPISGVRAQAAPAATAAAVHNVHKQARITLSSDDQARVQDAGRLFAAAGRAIVLTVSRTDSARSQTWSFDPASSPILRKSVEGPTTSVVYSVAAVNDPGSGSPKNGDALFDCARWTSFNMKCVLEIIE